MEIEGGSTRSHCVENLVWKGLWTCLDMDYRMMSGRVVRTKTCQSVLQLQCIMRTMRNTRVHSVGKMQSFYLKILVHILTSGFGGLVVACWPLVPKFAGSNPAEAVGFLGRKNPQHASFGGEVKPSVPCCRFAACKRSLNLRGSRNLGKITGQFLAHSSTFRC